MQYMRYETDEMKSETRYIYNAKQWRRGTNNTCRKMRYGIDEIQYSRDAEQLKYRMVMQD